MMIPSPVSISNYVIRISVLLMIILAGIHQNAKAQFSENIQFSGYLQAMPVYITGDFPPPLPDAFWEYRIQNRLNFRWFINQNFTFTAEARTRYFSGDLVKDIPFYSQLIDVDDGYMNLSWLIANEDTWLLHTNPDRLFLEWSHQVWNIRAGRQRVNWGINMVTNPNDIFNIYSFYEFDYPERPGTDAIRVQRHLDFASRVEVTVSPAKNAKDVVAAGLYAFNTNGYDIQTIAGIFRNRIAVGGGWAGSVSETGFKGEIMYFHNLDEHAAESGNFIAAISADHMFSNSLFLVTEVLYNHQGGRYLFDLFGSAISAYNPSFSKFQLATHVTYPVNPLLNLSTALMFYPDEEAVFISPSVNYSLFENIDINIVMQFFSGSDDSIFSNAGNVFAGSAKWNF